MTHPFQSPFVSHCLSHISLSEGEENGKKGRISLCTTTCVPLWVVDWVDQCVCVRVVAGLPVGGLCDPKASTLPPFLLPLEEQYEFYVRFFRTLTNTPPSRGSLKFPQTGIGF